MGIELSGMEVVEMEVTGYDMEGLWK
jgi:hypothetical protein